jgi:hypothetical protein
MWTELWILNLGLEWFVRLVLGTRHAVVTPSRKALLRSVSMTLHLWAWLHCLLWCSCSEVAVFFKILFLICVVTFPSILPVCVCIQFTVSLSRRPFGKRHIYFSWYIFQQTIHYFSFRSKQWNEVETSKRIVCLVHPESYTQIMRGKWVHLWDKPDSCTPPPRKFQSFEKAEPNSQFRGNYIGNYLIRIRVSLVWKLNGTPD